jgi:hypothetical protein
MDGLTKPQIWEAIRDAIRTSTTVTSNNLRTQYQVFKTASATGFAPPENQRRVDVNLSLEPRKATTFKQIQSAIQAANMPDLVKVNLALENDKGSILNDDT